jgi:hypothetical protein
MFVSNVEPYQEELFTGIQVLSLTYFKFLFISKLIYNRKTPSVNRTQNATNVNEPQQPIPGFGAATLALMVPNSFTF